MKRENVEIGMKVVPHSKSVPNYGDLENSHFWELAKQNNQHYLFVVEIRNDKIVLNVDNTSIFGDFFLPEDFEPYIKENKQNNNESRNINMKKSDLNSSMLFKMRNDVLYALLPDIEENLIFYDKIDIAEGYSGDGILFDDYNDDLSQGESDYGIVAIKQRNTCVKVIADVLGDEEPEKWDWVEDKDDNDESKVENTIQNITINITVDPNMDINDFIKELSSKWKNVRNF